MGQAPSNFFPREVIDCKTADAAAEGARYDYECTAKESVRYGLTLVHLFSMVFVFLLSMLLYLIYWRICERRLHAHLRSVPKRLPVGRDVLSLWMHRIIMDGFARVSHDKYLPKPQHPHPPPMSMRGDPKERGQFRTGVYVALQRLSVALREALASELHVLRDGLRGARALLVGPRFRVPPWEVDLVLRAMALAGFDYRGNLESSDDDDDESEGEGVAEEGGGTREADDGGLAQWQQQQQRGGRRPGSRSLARRKPLTPTSEGLQWVEAAVASIIVALEAAVSAQHSGGPDGDEGHGDEDGVDGDGEGDLLEEEDEEGETDDEDEEEDVLRQRGSSPAAGHEGSGHPQPYPDREEEEGDDDDSDDGIDAEPMLAPQRPAFVTAAAAGGSSSGAARRRPSPVHRGPPVQIRRSPAGEDGSATGIFMGRGSFSGVPVRRNSSPPAPLTGSPHFHSLSGSARMPGPVFRGSSPAVAAAGAFENSSGHSARALGSSSAGGPLQAQGRASTPVVVQSSAERARATGGPSLPPRSGTPMGEGPSEQHPTPTTAAKGADAAMMPHR